MDQHKQVPVLVRYFRHPRFLADVVLLERKIFDLAHFASKAGFVLSRHGTSGTAIGL